MIVNCCLVMRGSVDEAIYFCAKEDASSESLLLGRFSTYVCDRDIGTVTKLGEQS